MERLRIKTPSIYTETGSLSGGNQQKVAVARWLAIAPDVMILDEPTQGVDIGSKSEIHEIMGDLAAQGMAIVMISSELPEILGMSDRIAVMHGGTIAGVLSRAEATQEKVLALALGHGLMLERHRRETLAGRGDSGDLRRAGRGRARLLHLRQSDAICCSPTCPC